MKLHYTLTSIILFYTLMSIGLAEESSSLLSGDAKQLKDTILALPSLGFWGIILFLVAAVVAIGVWWWWSGKAKEITHRENEKQRHKDQAENKTENQDMSDEFNEAHERVEEKRKEDGAGTKPRPPRPESE